MNTIGIICALATFLNIWLGHVAVRYLEARADSINVPAMGFAFAGMMLLIGALASASLQVSAALGITGVILMWDAFEFFRQEKRIIKGHAPANPRNPRHVRILAEHPSAMTIDWLKREPLGRPYSAAEIKEIMEIEQ